MATWGTLTWNAGQWGAQTDFDVPVSGIGASFSIGTLTTTGEINTGWGSDSWGLEFWGLSGESTNVTGIQLSANVGSVTTTAHANVTPTGELIDINQGTATGGAGAIPPISGLSMTATLQYQEAVVDLTGIQLTSSLGTSVLDANTIVDVGVTVPSYYGIETWGFGAWGNESVDVLAMTASEGTVDPSPDATVTGIGFGMAVATGTVVSGTADLDVTGIAMTATLGQETIDLNTPVDVTGIPITATLSEESVVGDANAQCTGIGLTMSINSVNALIWSGVNTGSAPLDPPGWQEVPTRAA